MAELSACSADPGQGAGPRAGTGTGSGEEVQEEGKEAGEEEGREVETEEVVATQEEAATGEDEEVQWQWRHPSEAHVPSKAPRSTRTSFYRGTGCPFVITWLWRLLRLEALQACLFKLTMAQIGPWDTPLRF